jgi:hypothetical protein
MVTTDRVDIRQFIINEVDQERQNGASDEDAFANCAKALAAPNILEQLVEQLGVSIVRWI